MLSIDRTWQIGPVYLDICGSVHHYQVSIGIDLSFSGDPYDCWGRRISIHLLFWTISIGLDAQVDIPFS